MDSFIDVILDFYVGLFGCSVFLYFLAAFAFLSVVMIILRIVKG